MSARVAVVRWAWRMFRREWRRQLLVLALLTVAVAATVFGLGAAGTTLPSGAARFGAADYLITFPGDDPTLATDVAAARAAYPATEVISHERVAVPGSATAVDVRDQAPGGPLGVPMLRLDGGRYPAAAGETAVSARTARIFDLRIGSVWRTGDRSRTVVGLVENPNDLRDTFALVAPGRAGPIDEVTVLVRATEAQFRAVHRPDRANVQFRADDGTPATTIVLVLATVGLIFVGLLAAAGFTVLAQRRLRALGMLSAIGARHRHLRLVMLANGAAVGAVAAAAGGVLGAGAWILLAPRLENTVQHRIDRFHLPWWPIALALLLAFATSVLAAWWPARAAARVPVVAALSARPPQPRPAHRFALLGAVLLGAGLVALIFAGEHRPLPAIGGVAGITAGVLFLAPVAVAAMGALARACPLAARIALRDLARYRARAGSALAAVTLATGIAAAVIVGAGAAQAAATAPPTGGNLPGNELIVWISPERIMGPVPQLDDTRLASARGAATAIATAVAAPAPVTLTGAISPAVPVQTGADGMPGRAVATYGIPHPGRNGNVDFHGDEMIPLIVATPDLLRHLGIAPAAVRPTADLLTAHTDLSRYELLGAGREHRGRQPVVQNVTLPAYTSEPTILATGHLVRDWGLTPMTVGWLVVAPRPLTPAQIDRAEQAARAAGLTAETRPVRADLAPVRTGAAGIGAAVALGVLAMTVGLIRGEAGRDLRTLAANGAARGTRRRLTATTATALAALGAVLGTAGAYAAMAAWYHRDLHSLAEIPVTHLAGLVAGLPLVAATAGWLLAGREPPAIARTPLE